jgi:simple sugar transport system substrate-binding protein
MRDAAAMLHVECDFLGTEGVDIPGQIDIMRRAVEEGYDGLALNIIDPLAFDEVIQETMDKGVPVVGFNVDDQATPNARLSSVNQRLYEAGLRLGEHLLPEIPEGSHIVITMHDRDISALEDRLKGIKKSLEANSVACRTVISGNDAEAGTEVIAEALRKDPSIRIVLSTGQADTEAAGRAIEKYFPGQGYWAAGFDLSPKTLQLIREGHIRCTVDQQPYIQGFYPVVQLTHYLRYGIIPSSVDAGAAIIDKANVDQVAELTEADYR